MKILHRQDPWPNKVNFVDEKNVALGYDTEDECCAVGGWFLADDPEWWPADETGFQWPDTFKMESMDYPGWNFDTAYFKKRRLPESLDGDAAQFRITNGDLQKFITLYNHHNGYYAKGFEFTCPVDPTKDKDDFI